MTSNLRLCIIIVSLLFLALLPITSADGRSLYDYEFDDTTISAGGEYEIDLGQVSQGKELRIFIMSSEDVDVIMMTDAQHSTWDGTNFIKNGSELDTDFAYYTWTTETTDHFWLVIDNSAKVAGGASSGVEVTISSGHIDEADPYGDELSTRIVLEAGTMFHHEFGNVANGKQLSLSVDCEDWLSNDVDAFVVSEANLQSFHDGNEVWNRNASYLDIGLETWSFEIPSAGQWHVFVENGPRGEASQESEGIVVDISFQTSELISSEITDTTRMIETGDTWRVDLGTLSAGDVMSFNLAMDGFGDELDVLIMASSQADTYLQGQTATVLGHASLINTDFWDSWDYRFPVAGSYSMILDNSASPNGGAPGTSPIHVEIHVMEVTILDSWLGWYQSRHFVDDGGYVSFDLGQLEVDDEIYYMTSGNSHGSGFMNSYDVMLMTDSNYIDYTNGVEPTIITEASDMDSWLSFYNNYTIQNADHYWLVIDAADGPSGGADSNGAWTFDFTIKSGSGDIISPQTQDMNYEMSASHPQSTSDGGDDSTSGNSGNTNDGGSNDDIGDKQSSNSSSDGGGAGSTAGVVVALAVLIFLVRRRKNKKSAQAQGEVPFVTNAVPNQSQITPVSAPPGDTFSTQQQHPTTSTIPQQPQYVQPTNNQWVQSYAQLPVGGRYDYSQGTRYITTEGTVWEQQPDGSFRVII